MVRKMIRFTRTKCKHCKHNLSHLETFDGRVQDLCELNVAKEYHTYRIKSCTFFERKILFKRIFKK